MAGQANKVIRKAPWTDLTYRIIGLAMEVHNEIGPGHREATYHNAMAAKFRQEGLIFEDEPQLPVTLNDGTIVRGNIPDLVVEDTVIVELKARKHQMTRDDMAQIIGYFAVLPQCPVALFINFGGLRLEYRRLLPPQTVKAYQRQKWNKTADENG